MLHHSSCGRDMRSYNVSELCRNAVTHAVWMLSYWHMNIIASIINDALKWSYLCIVPQWIRTACHVSLPLLHTHTFMNPATIIMVTLFSLLIMTQYTQCGLLIYPLSKYQYAHEFEVWSVKTSTLDSPSF